MIKKDEHVAAVEINVTPRDACGHDVECDIAGHDVIDDAIILAKERTFQINFNLQGPKQWDKANPFNARSGKCPRQDAPAHGQYDVVACTDKKLTIEARAPGRKSIVHYRLNFADGTTCDPIIIRD